MIARFLLVFLAIGILSCCPPAQICPAPLPPVVVKVPVVAQCPVPALHPRPTCPDPGTSPAATATAAMVCIESLSGWGEEERLNLNGYRSPAAAGSPGAPTSTPR